MRPRGFWMNFLPIVGGFLAVGLALGLLLMFCGVSPGGVLPVFLSILTFGTLIGLVGAYSGMAVSRTYENSELFHDTLRKTLESIRYRLHQETPTKLVFRISRMNTDVIVELGEKHAEVTSSRSKVGELERMLKQHGVLSFSEQERKRHIASRLEESRQKGPGSAEAWQRRQRLRKRGVLLLVLCVLPLALGLFIGLSPASEGATQSQLTVVACASGVAVLLGISLAIVGGMQLLISRGITVDPLQTALETADVGETQPVVPPCCLERMEKQVESVRRHPSVVPRRVEPVYWTIPRGKASVGGVALVLLFSILGALVGNLVTIAALGIATVMLGFIGIVGYLVILVVPVWSTCYMARKGAVNGQWHRPDRVAQTAAAVYVVVSIVLGVIVLIFLDMLLFWALLILLVLVGIGASVTYRRTLEETEEELKGSRFCEDCREHMDSKTLMTMPLEAASSAILRLADWDLPALAALPLSSTSAGQTSVVVWGCPGGHLYYVELVVRESGGKRQSVFSTEIEAEHVVALARASRERPS